MTVFRGLEDLAGVEGSLHDQGAFVRRAGQRPCQDRISRRSGQIRCFAGCCVFRSCGRGSSHAGLPEAKVLACNPVIDVQRFRNTAPNGPDIMNVGAALPKKNMEDFIKLSRLVPHRTFNLYGLGYETPRLMEINAKLGGKVNFIAPVDPEDMPRRVQEARWLVYTASRTVNTVGWPMALVEAQASGVGVYVQRIREDLREYVGDAGSFFDIAEDLVDAIREPPSDAMRRRGFEWAEQFDYPAATAGPHRSLALNGSASGPASIARKSGPKQASALKRSAASRRAPAASCARRSCEASSCERCAANSSASCASAKAVPAASSSPRAPSTVVTSGRPGCASASTVLILSPARHADRIDGDVEGPVGGLEIVDPAMTARVRRQEGVDRFPARRFRKCRARPDAGIRGHICVDETSCRPSTLADSLPTHRRGGPARGFRCELRTVQATPADRRRPRDSSRSLSWMRMTDRSARKRRTRRTR